MRITLSAVLSASCSNLSPGWFTLIFICRAGTPLSATGSKKLPLPALANNGRLADCASVLDTVEDDFSAVVFIGFSAVRTGSACLFPRHPKHLPHPGEFYHRQAPG